MKSLAAFLLFLPVLAQGQETFSLKMGEAVSAAEAYSPELKAARARVGAKKASASSAGSYLYPRILFEGNLRYQTGVSEMKLALPGSVKTVRFGDNWNASAGPSLYYTLYDKGSAKNSHKASLSALKSAEKEYEAERRGVELAARLAYFDLKLALERLAFLEDAVAVAKNQYEEIRLKSRAGMASRQDELRAHQELNSRTIELIKARSAFAQAFRELAEFCGKWRDLNPSKVLPAGYSPRGTPPDMYVLLEPSEEILRSLRLSGRTVDGHPSLLSAEESVRALRLVSESLKAGLWPRAGLSLRSSLDYPEGTKTSSYWQNYAAVSVNVPLFESGRTKALSDEQKLKTLSAGESAKKLRNGLESDWLKAKDRLSYLEAQKTVIEENARESEEIAGLVYSSYKSGSSTYLEVQSANLKALEAKLLKAENAISILVQTAVLSALEGE